MSNQFPALAGGLLIAGPPGKSLLVSFTDFLMLLQIIFDTEGKKDENIDMLISFSRL